MQSAGKKGVIIAYLKRTVTTHAWKDLLLVQRLLTSHGGVPFAESDECTACRQERRRERKRMKWHLRLHYSRVVTSGRWILLAKADPRWKWMDRMHDWNEEGESYGRLGVYVDGLEEWIRGWGIARVERWINFRVGTESISTFHACRRFLHGGYTGGLDDLKGEAFHLYVEQEHNRVKSRQTAMQQCDREKTAQLAKVSIVRHVLVSRTNESVYFFPSLSHCHGATTPAPSLRAPLQQKLFFHERI